ncbi:MAG: hypothetical protein AAB917_03165 [Patescibacteria group bacterium]
MNTQQGFVKWVLIIIVALIVLGYFGFDIKKAIEAPTTQNNLTYVQKIVSNVWHNYLKKPAGYLWDIFVEYIWVPILDSLKKNNSDEQSVVKEPRGGSFALLVLV